MFEHGSTEHSRIHNGLTGAIGTCGVHHMCCVAQQRDTALNPGRNGITVYHRIFKYFRGSPQHGRDVDPVVVPILEMMQEIFMPDLLVPVAIRPAIGIVHGDLCYPVNVGKAGERVRS